MKIEGLNLLASAECDLRCKYCYIKQNDTMKKTQEDLLKKIKNEDFLNPVLKVCDNVNDITNIGLWGLEPTKVLDTLSERLDYLFMTLPKLEKIHFSTNLQGSNDRIFNFIKKVGTERKFIIGIQVSMDGMPAINDLTRGKGSGDKIVSNLKSLVRDMDILLTERTNLSATIADKSTLTSKILKLYADNPDLFKENFRYLNELYAEIYLYGKPDNRISMNFGGINAETPYDYSKEDGVNLYTMLQELDKLKNNENLKYITLPFYSKIRRILDAGVEFNNKNFMFSCGASKGGMSIGLSDDILSFCHRNFFPDQSKSVIDFREEYYSVHTNLENIKRQNYLTSCYTHFPKIKLNQIIGMCMELSDCDIIDKMYGKYDNAYLLAMFLVSESCPSESLDWFSTPYITYMGKIKLHANGAFNYMMRKIINE